jgi:Chaperone of endosialidase
MKQLIQLKTITLPLLVPLVLICLVLAPSVQALAPPPDGGYGGANTAEGTGALNSLVIPFRERDGGERNTALGFQTLLNLTVGDDNTATGYQALFSNITGIRNTATGAGALSQNTSDDNTADGYQALYSNTLGHANTATGYQALYANTEGTFNTAVGYRALSDFTAGGPFGLSENTAVGSLALHFCTTGVENTAIGSNALLANDTGSGNAALGNIALVENTAGFDNTAIGVGALCNNTTGDHNIALGAGAGCNVTTAHDVICIGAGVAGQDFDYGCYIGNIFGQTSLEGIPVFINSDNKLGITTSSKRFKEDIKPLGDSSEALFSLKPVTFRYKKEIDPSGRSQFGLVAEDVAKVNPDLVVRDKEGKPYSVRYEQVNAMLLNEFLKEHRTVQKLKKAIADLTATVKEQTAQIQKVSAQVEMTKPSSKVVLNDQ